MILYLYVHFLALFLLSRRPESVTSEVEVASDSDEVAEPQSDVDEPKDEQTEEVEELEVLTAIDSKLTATENLDSPVIGERE